MFFEGGHWQCSASAALRGKGGGEEVKGGNAVGWVCGSEQAGLLSRSDPEERARTNEH